MIAFLLAAAAAVASAPTTPIASLPGGDQARFEACVALAKKDAEAAIGEADAWAKRSNGVPARQCLGLALVAAERWTPAAIAFEQAAIGAVELGDGRAATLWTQAGNAALAGDDPGGARTYLDKALALPSLGDVMRGEAWLDRARADVALGDAATARTDLDKGLTLAKGDPFAWLLSATLARRQNDLPRATKDIIEATRLAPDDAAVALEAGNIAARGGQPEAAEAAWKRAIKLAPDEPEGRAAAQALASGAPPVLDYQLGAPAAAADRHP